MMPALALGSPSKVTCTLQYQHGRLKVRSNKEQEEARKKEKQEKAQLYGVVMAKIYAKRSARQMDNESLQLTREVLSANPEITTLWNYRREILQNREQTMSEAEFSEECIRELSLLEQCLRVNPKTYCVWLHRQWVLTNSPQPDWAREKALCDIFLKYDERNFHCWDYRRFVIAQSKCVSLSEEFAFTHEKIAANFSNYSAWHYRSQILPQLELNLDAEYELTQNAFFTDPDDQSAWFYHRWLLGEANTKAQLELVYLQKDPQPVLYSVFSQPTKGVLEVCVDEGIGQSVIGGIWPQAIYQCPLAKVPTTVKLSYDAQTIVISSDKSWWVTPNGVCHGTQLAAPLSVLQTELHSTLQLLDEEPTNKWCLLTTMLLMEAIDPCKYLGEIKDKALKLMEVDPYRKFYYSDLMSQSITKQALKRSLTNLSLTNRVFDLSSTRLHQLSLVEYLILYESIDLRFNSLSSLPADMVLPALTSLLLDGNNLVALPPIYAPLLQELSLRDNNISELCCIDAALKGLPSLEVLSLQGNPLSPPTESIRALVPTLIKLNEQALLN